MSKLKSIIEDISNKIDKRISGLNNENKGN